MVLPDDAPVGEDFRSWLNLDDTLITLKLTPNRADCLSMQGLAREVGAITGAEVRLPQIGEVADTHPGHAAGAGVGERGLPALSGARGARHQRAGHHAALDGGAAGAQRHPSAAGAGRHHQLRAARTRPADACLRPVAPQRRHRGAAGPRGRKTRTAERPDRRTRPRHAGDRRCQRAGGAGRHHGRAADQRGARHRRCLPGSRVLRAGGDRRPRAAAGPVHRFVAPLRARRRFRRHPPGDGARDATAARYLRRPGRADHRGGRRVAAA